MGLMGLMGPSSPFTIYLFLEYACKMLYLCNVIQKE